MSTEDDKPDSPPMSPKRSTHSKPERRRRAAAKKYHKAHPSTKGHYSDADKLAIEELALSNPTVSSDTLANGASRVLKRRKESIKRQVEAVREKFASQAESYLDAHNRVLEAALRASEEDKNARAMEQARLASEWGLENISLDEARIVDKNKKEESSGVVVNVGLKIGGMKDPTDMVVEALDPQDIQGGV